MSDEQTLHKYYKYKTKYLKLKRANNDVEYNFYFIHSTTNFNNLLDILKTGVLYPGKYLRPDQRKFCGEECESEYIYTNIYFEDIKNIDYVRSYSLLLHPQIMLDNGFYFNKGWIVAPTSTSIHVDNKDTMDNEQKITQIKEFLVNPVNIPEIMKAKPGLYTHEVLFDHHINLDKNLVGIVCRYCNESYSTIWNDKPKELSKPSNNPIKLIKKAIANKPYRNVKIMTDTSMRTLKELTQI